MAEYIEREALIKNLVANAIHCISFGDAGEGRGYIAAKEVALSFPAADVVEVVRCEKCYWYKPRHFKADDGTEHPWDGLISPGGRTDGVYIGGKCEIDKNNGYAEDKSVFRKATDFCSRGERRSE